MDVYDEPTATGQGRFTDGDPLLGIPRTVLRSNWPNAVQDELLNVITGAGLTPSGEQFDQLLAAIHLLANRSFVGQIFSGPYAVVPDNCLVLEGGWFLEADYPALTDYIEAYYAPLEVADITDITWFGRFRRLAAEPGRIYLPDLRGQVVRGWANGSDAVDPDGDVRELGEYQADELKAHDHTASTRGVDTSGGGAVLRSYSGSDNTTGTGQTGGDETRAKNIAWRWLIQAV